MKLISILIIILGTSCADYTHIYRTAQSGLTKNLESSFDNDSLRIEYDFWSEQGQLSFTVYNKLSVPVYVDWGRSSFIYNNVRLSYWEDGTKEKSAQETTVFLLTKMPNDFLLENQQPPSSVEQISFIPPHAVVNRTQYRLRPGFDFPFKFTSPQTKAKKTDRDEIKYTESNSPLRFRNFMTLSLTKDFKNEFYVDNGFFVSGIIQIKTRQFLGANDKEPGKHQQSLFQNNSSFYMQVMRK